MSGISNVYHNAVAPNAQTEQVSGTYQTGKKSYIAGKTIGNPQLR